MERSEPTLVPEWLKSSGSSTGGASITHSDDHAASRLARNKSFVSSNGHDFGRSSSTDRATSSYFRRSSSSNGSGHLRSYSSFGRNQRDRDWEKDTYESRKRDKSVLGEHRQLDFSDPLGNSSSSKFERDGLRRSHSMISAKRGDNWSKKVVTNSSGATGNNSNALLTKGTSVGGINKSISKRDFPSLGTERIVVPEVGRVPSPGLSSAIPSLPIGTSASLGGEKWSSALAEVPVLAGNGGNATSLMQQPASSTSTPLALGSGTSLNMAEAVAHGPTRPQTTPQLSVGTQRLEELAIKQSRQLIPVTPLMPKISVFSSSEKQKLKGGQQQHPLSSAPPANQSPRAVPGKGDVLKTSSVGKLLVLKPVREKNGVTSVPKDNLSPLNDGKAVLTAAAPASGSGAAKGAQSSPLSDRKPVLTVLEKRPTSQAQSRNDFFNLVRKKSMANSSSGADAAIVNTSSGSDDTMANSSSCADATMSNSSPVVETETALSASSPDKLADVGFICSNDIPFSGTVSGDPLSERGHTTCNDDACDAQKNFINGRKHLNFDPISSEEEEAAFLRSLGWEENADEGGLTEEEITAFFKDISKLKEKFIESNPSLKILQGVKPKFLLPFDSQVRGIGCISSGLNSSDAKLES